MENSGVLKNRKGFTLVELLIVMVIAGVVLAAVFQMYNFQQKNAVVQEQVTDLQQNLRASMYLMERDIRMAGYDPLASHNFGFTYAGFRDLNDNPDSGTATGRSAIAFTSDLNGNGVIDGDETISYAMYDFAATDNNLDLMRDDGRDQNGVIQAPGVDTRQLLAENIAAVGFAYAFDSDGDNQLDTYASGAGNQVIWAIDSDNNGTLDANLDTNNDGVIDQNDLGAGGVIDGQAIFPVALDKIRAVRIWLLAKAPNPDTAYADQNTWVVGRQVINTNDNFRRRVLDATVQCRNMGLN